MENSNPLIEACPNEPILAQWYCRGVSETLNKVIGSTNSWVLSGWLNELVEHVVKLEHQVISSPRLNTAKLLGKDVVDKSKDGHISLDNMDYVFRFNEVFNTLSPEEKKEVTSYMSELRTGKA